MESTELKKTIGRHIREARDERGLSQGALAREVGIDAPRLSRIERGERGIDSLVLRRIASFFALPMDAFFENPKKPSLGLARRGAAEDEAMQEMLVWGEHLHQVGAIVESEWALRG